MIIENLDDLKKFAYKLAPLLEETDLISLVGDMGAGKTTLVNDICSYFGIDDSSSPTFAIVNIYEGDKTIYHLDLYRFDDPDDILDIDFETYFYPDHAISFIEWAENAGAYLPEDLIEIRIDKLDDNRREITIGGKGERSGEINELLSN